MWWAPFGYYRQPLPEAFTERLFLLLILIPWLALLEKAAGSSPRRKLARLGLIAFCIDRMLVDYVLWLPVFAGAASVWAAFTAARRGATAQRFWWLGGGMLSAGAAAAWASECEPLAFVVVLFTLFCLYPAGMARQGGSAQRPGVARILLYVTTSFVLLLGAVEYLTRSNFIPLAVLGVVGWTGLQFASWRNRQRAAVRRGPAGRLLDFGASLICGLLCTVLLAEVYFRYINDWTDVNSNLRTSQRWFQRHVKYNSWGYRDREFPALEDSGVAPRILVIGDSFAFGSGIPEDADRLGPQLERELRRRLSASTRVCTMAIPGINTRREIQMFEADGWRCRPDVVVLAYHVNDIAFPGTHGQPPGQSYYMWGPLLHSSDFIEFFAWRVHERLHFGQTAETTTSITDYQDDAIFARLRGDILEFTQKIRAAGARPVAVLFPFLQFPADTGLQRAAIDRVAGVFTADGVPFVDVGRTIEVTERKYHANPFDPHPSPLLFREITPLLADKVTAALQKTATRPAESRPACTTKPAG